METLQRPSWLNKKISLRDCAEVKSRLKGLGLNTVCEEALCPNIGECFAKSQATFLILGNVCTRLCTFCGVKRGITQPADPGEPKRVAEGVRSLGLKHVVVTSVTRDDLPDGGAQAFVDTIHEIRKSDSNVTVEILTPDFKLNKYAIAKVVDANPEIFAHNIETVPRLYSTARNGSGYQMSLSVLSYIKKCDPSMRTKSGIMLGMGESDDEVLTVIRDIAGTGCDFLSIGQYLAPSKAHLAVKEYISPEKFIQYKKYALEAGFRHVASGTYVRSSYSASEYLETEEA